jgi:hypothetical protein
MTAPPASHDGQPAEARAFEPACPCGGQMWFLPFGYDSWVCRRNTRHWFRPGVDQWSGEAKVQRLRPHGEELADAVRLVLGGR